MICAAFDYVFEMGASYTQQQPPPDLLASAASAPMPSAASVASSSAAASQQQQQQQRRKTSCPKLGENIVMLLCLSRVRRMGGRWYRAVSHMRTGKRKKEKKRPYRPADYDRMRDASDAAMDMSEMELAEIVANLLKKVFKEIQDDCREAFVRAWLREDDTRCVLTVPDGKGKMKRIDGLRGSDKVWRLDTLVAMLYHGVPMDSTDTGLLVHRCEDELCVNPRHLSFQCSPAMMAVAMEMLRVAGYDVAPRVAATAAADPSGNCRYFQFTSPFPMDVIRREMNESMALPQAVLDRYQLSADDAAYVQDNFPETMATYRRLLAGGGTGSRIRTGGSTLTAGAADSDARGTAGTGSGQQQQQQQQQQPIHRDQIRQHASLLSSLSSYSAAGLLLKSEAVSPASCSSASATPSSAASAGGGGGKRPPSESPTNAHMPFKKRRPMSSTDFTPATAPTLGGEFGGYGGSGSGSGEFSSSLDQRPASDEGAAVKLGAASAAPPLSSQSHFDPHNQSFTDGEVDEINRPAAAAAAAVREVDAATVLASLHRHTPHDTLLSDPATAHCPEFGGYSIFSEGLSSSASATSASLAVASEQARMPAPPSAPPLPRPRPLVPRQDGTLAERDSMAVGHAVAAPCSSMSAASSASAVVPMSSSNFSASSATVPMLRGFRPILTYPGSTTPVGHSPLLNIGRNDTPTAIRIILELQGSSGGGGGGDAASSAAIEHLLRATPGATPTWPFSGGGGGGAETVANVSTSSATADAKSATASASQQRQA